MTEILTRASCDLAIVQAMLPSLRTSLAQRALGALGLTRSFLLLEDDYDVDWEVDGRNESLRSADIQPCVAAQAREGGFSFPRRTCQRAGFKADRPARRAVGGS